MSEGGVEKQTAEKGEDSADYEVYMGDVPKRKHPFNLKKETTIALKLWKADREASLYIRERTESFFDRMRQKVFGSEEVQRKKRQKKSRSRSKSRSKKKKRSET